MHVTHKNSQKHDNIEKKATTFRLHIEQEHNVQLSETNGNIIFNVMLYGNTVHCALCTIHPATVMVMMILWLLSLSLYVSNISTFVGIVSVLIRLPITNQPLNMTLSWPGLVLRPPVTLYASHDEMVSN